MKIINTDFNGLFLIEPQSFKDSRGEFYESWKEDAYAKAGIKHSFLQDNVSFSRKNVLRGLHFQKNQGQLVTVTQGRIYDVAVDIRPYSHTYKKYFSIMLDSRNPQQLYMPDGFAHGFCVLSDFAIINYKCTSYYDPSLERGIIWNDPDLNIQWPNKDFIISEKDKNFPNLREYCE